MSHISDLDPTAQSLLLDETPEVFSDEDRIFFSKAPTLVETKESVWKSNLTGSPAMMASSLSSTRLTGN